MKVNPYRETVDMIIDIYGDENARLALITSIQLKTSYFCPAYNSYSS